MKLWLAQNGNYPRIGDSPALQVLRRTLAALDRGEATAADVEAAMLEMTRQALADQLAAGLDVVTDGQIRWHDPVSHLAGRLVGVRINGLLRFFDTNFYFRQPVLAQPPRRQQPLVVEEFLAARRLLAELDGATHDRVLKAVLTGPYTLARLSLAEAAAIEPLERRVQAYAEALAAEVEALAAAGARQIQVDEPAILFYPEDWPVFAAAIERLVTAREAAAAAGHPTALVLYVYFRDCSPLYERLAALPVDGLGLDFTYGERLAKSVMSSGSRLPLAFGLLDGRNTRLEEPAAVARQLERLLPAIRADHCWLGCSCGLEYLPRDRARAKLELLGKIRALVAGAG
jgi:5-methyltetrahydropteroyltriglutamate--homocysteine methyltransferase